MLSRTSHLRRAPLPSNSSCCVTNRLSACDHLMVLVRFFYATCATFCAYRASFRQTDGRHEGIGTAPRRLAVECLDLDNRHWLSFRCSIRCCGLRRVSPLIRKRKESLRPRSHPVPGILRDRKMDQRCRPLHHQLAVHMHSVLLQFLHADPCCTNKG